MLAYPVTLETDGRKWFATSTDFPNLTAAGNDKEEAVGSAVDALLEAIAALIHDEKDIPKPSGGDTFVILPTVASVKVMLYEEMREQGISKPELGRRTGWYWQQVERILDVRHRTRFDLIETALQAVGKNLYVTAASGPVVTPERRDREVAGVV